MLKFLFLYYDIRNLQEFLILKSISGYCTAVWNAYKLASMMKHDVNLLSKY